MHIRETLSPQEFEHALRAKGAYYHIHHPYHIAMHNGEASREQIQGWVANRFYYQTTIPLKDAAIMANCPDPHTRRKWVQRILDHDGSNGHDGGIEAWLQLGEAVGLSREDLISERHVLPGVRFAVDAYVNFGHSTTRGSKRKAIFISAAASARPAATLNTVWSWRSVTAIARKSRIGCWRSFSSNSISCGRCSTR